MANQKKLKIRVDSIKADACIFKGNIALFVITPIALLFFVWITDISLFRDIKPAALFFVLFGMFLAWGLIGLMIYECVRILYKYLHNLFCIKNGKITIKKFKLISTKQYRIRNAHHIFYKMHFPEKVIFHTSDEAQTYYYKWVISEEKPSVFGADGDEYYLVFLGKSKNPCMIYNTRYFYIEGE